MRHTHTSTFTVALVALIAFFAQAQRAGAQQPLISSISGSATQGAMLTIIGSSLNAETKQGWDGKFARIPTAWSFEGTSPSADEYQPGGSTTGVYDSTVKLLGNQSIKFHTKITNPTCVVGVGQSYNYTTFDDPSTNNEYWLRVYVRFNRISNWPNYFQKMLEPLNSGYYFQPNVPGVPAGSDPSSWDATHDAVLHSASNPGGAIQSNRWYAIELHWGYSPRVYEAWVDGVQVYSGTPTSGSNLYVLLFGVINACGSVSWDVEQWMDGLAVGHQRIYPSAVVEVGNSSNYSTATKRTQAIESIADGQITFRLDTTGLGPGPYYVWVRNNARQLSVGFFLTGGQVSGPVAPANLRIVP